MTDYHELRSLVQSYLPSDALALVDRAYEVSRQAHEGQLRHSGEPYVGHPIAVAYILAQYSLDAESICACLLHDVLEDTEWTFEDISQKFGYTIATLVDGVSKLQKIEFPSKAHEQAENLWKMMLAIAQDLRVIIIKLADRIHNMRTLGALRKVKQHRKALETLEIYAPIAARIGMYEFKKEFEELGFSAIYPKRAQVLESAIETASQSQKMMIEEIISYILSQVKGESPSVVCLILKKSAYEIHGIMKKDHIHFRDLRDFCVLEVICKNVDACYQILGILHQAYRPLMDNFRDYIALPKGNGYQSLHTTVMLSQNQRVEIHIRSEQMNAIALRGVAADSQEQYQRVQNWIASMIQARHEQSTSIEFAQQFKEDLHREDLYISDEKGNIWSLPQGSTPIDFAYLHQPTQASYCERAYVDNKLVLLSTPLKNGQTLALKYGVKLALNPGWLVFAGSAKVRAHIHQELRARKHKEATALGEKIFLQALDLLNRDISDLQKSLNQPYWGDLGFSSEATFFLAIGLGKIDVLTVLQSQKGAAAEPVLEMVCTDSAYFLIAPSACCHPDLGDRVRVFSSGQEGWEAHREDCLYSRNGTGSPSFLMKWTLQSSMSIAELEVSVMHQPGALARITQVIAQLHSNIQSVYTDCIMHKMEQKIWICLTVQNMEHLQEIMIKLGEIPFVRHIEHIG